MQTVPTNPQFNPVHGIQPMLIACSLWLGLTTAAWAVDALSSVAGAESSDPLWEIRLADSAVTSIASSFRRRPDQHRATPLANIPRQVSALGEDSESPIQNGIRRDRIKLDLSFDINFPVDSDDITARSNMPDLDLLLEVGPEVELQFTKIPKWGGHWYLGYNFALPFLSIVSNRSFAASYSALNFPTG